MLDHFRHRVSVVGVLDKISAFWYEKSQAMMPGFVAATNRYFFADSMEMVYFFANR